MENLLAATQSMSKALEQITFRGDVACIYNPLDYAWDSHEQYLLKYGVGQKRVLFLGMNPGPYGMVQTGVPFGEIDIVKNWLKIEGMINQPDIIHPKRPIDGYDCIKSEVSGKRFWGMMADRFPDAHDFFDDAYVVNFCPLVWMTESGKNITPDKLPKAEMKPVYKICNAHIQTVIEYYQPKIIVGVGAFAEQQVLKLKNLYFDDKDFKVGRMLHPSPASPIANKFWPERAIEELVAMGVWSND